MASDAEVQYHRSFLSLYYLDNLKPLEWFEKAKRKTEEIAAIRLRDPRKFEDTRKALAEALKVKYVPGRIGYGPAQSGGTHWIEGTPSDYAVAEVMKPTQPPQAAVKHPTSGAIAFPNVSIGLTNAYIHDQVLHPVKMYHKIDQRFEEHATPWELVWSNLSYPYDRGFTPIIDDSYKVIGHFGSVVGGPKGGSFYERSLIVPRDANVSSLEVAMAKGVPVFVHSATGLPSGWRNGNFESTERKIEVRTGLDGEVTSFQYILQGALVQPWYSPIDIIVAAKIVVNLTRIGAKVATSLMNKATAKLESRAALNGPTESLAKDGTKASAKSEVKAVVREIVEADLEQLPRMRGASRVLTPPEMETFLKEVLSKKPWLARLRVAHRLDGKSLDDALMKILKEWQDSTGKLFLPVNKGSVKRLGSSGEGGWARDKLSGKEVLIIEKEAVRSPKKFLEEVTHELSYEAVRTATGQPALNEAAGILRFSMDWLERVIKDPEGARVWAQLLSMGK